MVGLRIALPLLHRSVPPAVEAVLKRSGTIVERGQVDPVPRRNGLYLVNFCRGDKPPPLREWFKSSFQSQHHRFEQTSMHDVWKRMAIQNSAKIRRESHSTADLSQASKEDPRSGHLCAG